MKTTRLSISQIAWRNVVRKLFRNIVLVLAVSGLVGLLVFALLFNRIITEDIDSATRRLGADIVIVPAEAQDVAEEFILESKKKTFYMDDFLLAPLADLPGIDSINSHTYLNTLDAGCCSIDEGQVIVFDADNDFVIKPWLGENSPKKLKKGEVFVGNYVYEFLGLIDTASLFGQGVKVVGHLEHTGTGLDHGIFMRKEDIDQVSSDALGGIQKGTLSIIFIKVKDGVNIDELVAKIRNINPVIGIMTRGSIGADVRHTLADIMRIFTVTIVISTGLAILLAWSTFSALANERRREIGILRAIGASQKQIIRLFLTEAFIISAIGGIAGILLGHYLIHYLADGFYLISRLDTGSTVSSRGILYSFFGIIGGILVCLLGALFPIVRLAMLEPLDAMKEE